MKHFLLLTFVCLSMHAVSQEKISGIGRFKIGIATTSLMSKVASESKVPVKVSVKNPDMFAGAGVRSKKTHNILLLSSPSIVKDSSVMQNHWYINLKEVKVYYVDYMEIAKVPVMRTFLFFFNDTLYKIHSSEVHKDFIEAVKLKYGEGTAYNNSVNFNCKENGVSQRLTGVNNLMTWVNNSIKTTYYFSEMFDTFCKPLYQSYFIIVNEKTDDLVKQAIEEKKRKKKEEESTRKIRSLEDF